MNPFVNFKQRGVELPRGCKDLNDVLSKFPSPVFGWPHQYKQGTLADVRNCANRLYHRPYGEKTPFKQTLFILHWQKNVLLMATRDRGFINIEFMLRPSDAFVSEAITEIFGEKAQFTPSPIEGFQTVRVPLPESWEESAQLIIDFLLRAYGISEDDKFIFSFQDGTVLPHAA